MADKDSFVIVQQTLCQFDVTRKRSWGRVYEVIATCRSLDDAEFLVKQLEK